MITSKATPNTFVFIPAEHGFFDDLVTMLVSLSSYMYTMHVSLASNHPTPFEQRPLEEWVNYLLPIRSLEFPFSLERTATKDKIIVFPAAILMHLSLDGWPDFIEYQVAPALPTSPEARLTAQGNRHVIGRIVGASFTNYYSNCEATIKAGYSNVIDKWPEPLRFAWVIRNGFAHGGNLRISDTKLRPATWKIWSFDHSDDDAAFLFTPGKLGIGDIITLMEDIDTFVRP